MLHPPELVFVIGRTWSGAPPPWKNFCRSLPTHVLLKGVTMSSKQSVKKHRACIQKVLKQFDAEYHRASNKHAARIIFENAEGKLAWELTYA